MTPAGADLIGRATEYSDLSRIVATNVPIVLALGVLGVWVFGKVITIIWNQNKETQALKDKLDASAIAVVSEKLGDLVDQIKLLVIQRKEDADELDGVKDRVSSLEGKYSSLNTKCIEREKMVNDRFKVIHHRVGEPCPPVNRIDREN